MPWALAVDIGGTKLAAGLVDHEGSIAVEERVPTGEPSRPDELWASVLAVVDAVLAAAPEPPVVCGVGCGGPMSPGGADVSPLNIPAWRAFPLRSRLGSRTGLPTFVDNDAKALALAEGWLGAARGTGDYVAMVVSTGVGGGVVVDGRLLDGATGNAGHIGHVIVEPDGRRCGCGARGCLEAEASGLAIQAVTGRPPADAGPEVIRRTGRLVGRAVASVVSLLDLRLAVVAGSVALGFGTPFFDAAQAELEARARISYAAGARIRPAGLGGEGPLVGAAAVGWRGYGLDLHLGSDRGPVAR
ncbi:MAG: ROK family protein [Acidimicrobiales bacterium]|nr:ROK family protein [Acidimicrobiales bacterium]